jgi:small-conductance mechanosensitive channel
VPVARRDPDNKALTGLRRQWAIGILAGVVALAALVAGSAYGKVHAKALDPRLIVWISAAVILVAGIISTTRISANLGRLVSRRSLPAAGGAVRILSAACGYLFVLFAVLAVVTVPIEHLLVGAGLAGVVLGIAAQQSLGNVFAGLVLMLARPLSVGDHIRVRAGSLGGIFDAWVEEMSLTYVTLRADDGVLKVPNSAMLAAGIGRLPRWGPVPPLAVMTPPPPSPPPAAARTTAGDQDGPDGRGEDQAGASGASEGGAAAPP